MADYSDVKPAEGHDLDALQRIVLGATSTGRKKKDAPQHRLTASTFPNNASILDWVQRGDLVAAIKSFNAGGTYNPSSREFFHRDFWLMRIFDVMEELGRAQFERYVPNVWDSILRLYYDSFMTKIIQEAPKPAQAVTSDLYGEPV